MNQKWLHNQARRWKGWLVGLLACLCLLFGLERSVRGRCASPRWSAPAGFFGRGGGAAANARLVHVASQGSVRGGAGEEGLVDGRLDGAERWCGGARQHHPWLGKKHLMMLLLQHQTVYRKVPHALFKLFVIFFHGKQPIMTAVVFIYLLVMRGWQYNILIISTTK